jgi:3',5'-cyclic AMP phosphodiesterase CpdA
MPITIAHLSDLHLPLPGRLGALDLLNKRLLGWANLRLLRSGTHRLEPFKLLLSRVVELDPDLVLISGDLTNLALPAEYKQIDQLLGQAGLKPETTLLLPGNHDRYTPQADQSGAFETGLARWLPAGFDRDGGWPLTRELGPVQVIGLDTAVWRGPIRAAGRLSRAQLQRLKRVLHESQTDGRHRVIALHHAPFALDGVLNQDYRSGLTGRKLLMSLLGDRPTTLLHGHLHRLGRRRLGSHEIIGVPSASNDTGRIDSQLACHLLTFDAQGLVRAKALRIWPDRGRDSVERVELPEEALRV